MSVLNYSVLQILSFYRRITPMGAYALPEEVSPLLFQVWIADTRGESFELGGEIGGLQVTDAQRQWMCGNRAILQGQIAEIKAMNITHRGAAPLRKRSVPSSIFGSSVVRGERFKVTR
jgi:hypothetical protein